jgi:eukaryotic-like serine/threonine-protein kinase
MMAAPDEGDVGYDETLSPSPEASSGVDPAAVTQPSSHVGEGRDLGARPASDKLQRAVARAKIAGNLFATDERVKLGRYHLLELVGAGGMGVVWAAWDPELDRRVAIKLVKATMAAARDRILLEGQALAKLSHPNVVPVFDVGVVEEQVYLVMEYVRGKNLRAYCKEPRTVREIVAVYRDAALGLAAAHHAGLIHRDFKPDNAIRGDDGRVRVLDFGLARGEARPGKGDAGDESPEPSSDLTRGAGTPRYMPPEQAEGRELSPAVDQYAFCVSLREALVGRNADHQDADVPGWLDAIITRGTAREVAARFPSMDDVLRALARDPRTVWRRRAIVTGALGLAAGAFVIGSVRSSSDEPERCVGGKAEIAKVWTDAVRGQLGERLAKLSAFAAEEAPGVLDDLGRYAGGWELAHRDACQANVRGELPEQIYERTVACFARAKFSLGAVVDVLGTAPAEKMPEAIVAARSLPDATRCATDAPLSLVALPSPAIAGQVTSADKAVEEARVLALAGSEKAEAASVAALERAERLGYLPLVARAQLARGMSLMVNDLERAATTFGDSVNAAVEAGDDTVAVEAFARRVYVTAITSSDKARTDVLPLASLVDAIAKRSGTAPEARALLYMNLGTAHVSGGDRDGARRWFEQSRQVTEGTRASSPELLVLPANTALVTDDPEQRRALLRQSVDALAGALGPTHPKTLTASMRLAVNTPNGDAAASVLGEACEAYDRLHPHFQGDIADCMYELGWLELGLGRREDARRHFARSEELSSVTSPEAFIVSARELSGMYLERRADIAAKAEEVAKATAKGEPWAQYFTADAYTICGMAAEESTDLAAARRCYRAGIVAGEGFVKAFPVFYDRRLAYLRARLALSLPAGQGRDVAAAALAWYETAGGYDEMVARLRPLIAE